MYYGNINMHGRMGGGYAPPQYSQPCEEENYDGENDIDEQEEAFLSDLDRLSSQAQNVNNMKYFGSSSPAEAPYPHNNNNYYYYNMDGNQKVQLRKVQEGDFNPDEVVETNTAASAAAQRTIGDFEVFRLAKQGGNVLSSCMEIADLLGVDIKTSQDNAERNILHYAVDSGDAGLVEALRKAGVPVKADAKGMTPAHVAVVISGAGSEENNDEDDDEEEGRKKDAPSSTRQSSVSSSQAKNREKRASLFQALLAALSTGENPTAPLFSSPEERHRDEVLQHWAPAPPRFTFGSPAAAPPVLPSKAPSRRFWGRLPSEVIGKGGKSYSSAVMGGARGTGEASSVAVKMELSQDEMDRVWERIETIYLPPSRTLDAWSLPFSKATLWARRKSVIAVQVNMVTSEIDRKMGVEGAGVAQLLGFRLDGGAGDKADCSIPPPPSPTQKQQQQAAPSSSCVIFHLSSALWVGMMGVAPAHRQQGKAAELLCRLISIPIVNETGHMGGGGGGNFSLPGHYPSINASSGGGGGGAVASSSHNSNSISLSSSSWGDRDARGGILQHSAHLPSCIQRIIFTVPELPLHATPTPTAVCLIKTFRRSLRPLAALAHPLIFEKLYQDVQCNDCCLRTDIALKETLLKSQREAWKTTGASQEWSLLVPRSSTTTASGRGKDERKQKEKTASEQKQEEEEEVVAAKELLAFLQASFSSSPTTTTTTAPPASTAYGLAFVPLSLAELRSSLLAPGMITCVRRRRPCSDGEGGDGSAAPPPHPPPIEGVVTYRVRHFRPSAEAQTPLSASAPPPIIVAEVVYAHLPGYTAAAAAAGGGGGAEKMEHLLLVAEKYLHASTLLVPTMFGFTDSDLGKAHFTECISLRRFLYVVDHPETIHRAGALVGVGGAGAKSVGQRDVLGTTSPPIKLPIPSSKVSIPLLF